MNFRAYGHLVRSMIAVAALAGASQTHAAATLYVSPAVASAPPSTASINIAVANRTPGSAIGSFDLGLAYDPSIWTPTSATFGLFLGDAASLEALTAFDFSTPGTVRLLEVSLIGPFDPLPLTAIQPATNTKFSLATVTFSAVGPGVGSFRISEAQLTDQLGVSINVVPEPGTWTLLAIGMAAVSLNGLRRRSGANGRTDVKMRP